MNVNFATKNITTAKKYLENAKYDWLSTEMKEIIINNLGDDCKVQDPEMYSHPRITVFEQRIADLINVKEND